MQNKIKTNLLLDFYGGLLTEKQQEICKMYYRDDLSLQEIAEIVHISRSGVHDFIKRSESDLEHYENVLQLVKKMQKRNMIYVKIDEIATKEVKDLILLLKDTEGGNYD